MNIFSQFKYSFNILYEKNDILSQILNFLNEFKYTLMFIVIIKLIFYVCNGQQNKEKFDIELKNKISKILKEREINEKKEKFDNELKNKIREINEKKEKEIKINHFEDNIEIKEEFEDIKIDYYKRGGVITGSNLINIQKYIEQYTNIKLLPINKKLKKNDIVFSGIIIKRNDMKELKELFSL